MFFVICVIALLVVFVTEGFQDRSKIAHLSRQLEWAQEAKPGTPEDSPRMLAYDVYFWLTVVLLGYLTFFWERKGELPTWLRPQMAPLGLGGLSFMTLVGGLNLAIRKKEPYSKTAAEIEADLISKVKLAVRMNFDPGSNVLMAAQLEASIQQLCHLKASETHENRVMLGILFRRLAIHLTVLSGVLLFFQLTTGVFGALLVVPILGDYLLQKRPLASKDEVLRLQSVIVDFYVAKRDREDWLESLSVWSYEI